MSGEEDEDDRMSTVIPHQLENTKQTNTTSAVLSLVVGRAQLSLCTDLPITAEVNIMCNDILLHMITYIRTSQYVCM